MRKDDNDKFPQNVLVSYNGEFEFPFNWTRDFNHLNVVYVHNFTTVKVAESEDDLVRISESHWNCDWCADTKPHLMLFKDKDIFLRFKSLIPHPRCTARIATKEDYEEYRI